MRQEFLINTKLCVSSIDLPHFENLGEDINSEYIFCPEALVRNDRKDFSEDSIEIIQNDWVTIKSNYPDSKVIGFIQFSKNNKVRDVAKYESKITFEQIKNWLDKNCAIIESRDVENYLNKTALDLMLGDEENGK